MITLTVDNSFSRIEGLSPDQFSTLREKLSYRVDAQEAYFGGLVRSPKRYLINKRGEFPTGLLHHVQDWMGAMCAGNGTTGIEDRREHPLLDSLPLKANYGDKIPRDSQWDAFFRAIEFHRGVIRMPTRSGKSLVMGMIINALKIKTLIVVPSVGLRDQLRKDMLEWFGETPNIVIENIDSPALKTLKDFDMLILDEAHHAAAKTYRELNKKAWGKIYFRFFFTATPFRSNSEEQLLMESVTGKVIYSMSFQDALAEGCVVPVEAYYVDVPDVEIDSNHWRTVYNLGVVHHEARNGIISSLMTALAAAGKSVLTLVREIPHGKAIEGSTGFPFANGQDGLVRMRILEFNLKETLGLTGTVGVLGEGMTLPPCEYVLIAGGGKSRIQFMQNVGRALGKYPGKESAKIILFRDRSHKFLRRHFNAQLKTLREEYGVVPARLVVSNV